MRLIVLTLQLVFMKLLFICTHNRCRSILAEAITRHKADGKIIAASAGSSPQGEVHPLSLRYLSEHDVSVDGLKSQSWDEFEQFNPDAVLTLCDSAACETCPVWFDDLVQVHWGLVDPSKQCDDEAVQKRQFSNTIDIIERRIDALMEHDIESLKGPDLTNVLEQIATQIH